MADSRSLTFGVQFGMNTAPLDTINEKQKKAQTEAEKTAEKIEQIGTSLNDIGARGTKAFNSVAGSSSKMGTSVRSAMLKSITAGNSLSHTLLSGVGAAIVNLRAKFKGWGAASKSVIKDVGNSFRHPVQAIKATLGSALSKAQSGTKKLGADAKTTGDKLHDMGTRGASAGSGLVSMLKKTAVAMGALMIIKEVTKAVKEFFNASVNAAAKAEETISKFGVVFKESTASTQAWAEHFADSAKRSKNEVMGFLADAGAFLNGSEMAADKVASLSKEMAAATYDLASFHNLADADVFAKLRSGAMGETEGLKTLGIVMTDTTKAQAMMRMGIQGTFNDLDEATKIEVRWNAIMAQSSDAMGDATRTSGSYTNSLKGIKGLWSDFLANAGAKFTPVLTGLFNTIIKAWPRIEPALMGLVDMLGNGLNTAVPVLIELGENLLPVFTDAFGVIFQVLTPVIPVFGSLIKTLLPPLMSMLSMLASSLLPPIVNILDVLNKSILQPLMPVFVQIVGSLLPPLATLLEAISPILEGIAPIISFVAEVLGFVAEILGKIIGWVANGIGKVADFFGKLFGGAKSANGEMSKLADSTNAAAVANKNYGASTQDVGTTVTTPTYDWPQSPGGPDIPGNAGGTDNWRGGPTKINEDGGEFAVLPSGTKIIPADKTDKIISNSRNSKQTIFAPNIQIIVEGDASPDKIQRLKEELRAELRAEYERMREQEAKEDALQEALI